jgi:hypothetical protein
LVKKTNLSKRRRNYPQQKRENIALFFEKSSKVKKLSAKSEKIVCIKSKAEI